jgi:hypothetical protein
MPPPFQTKIQRARFVTTGWTGTEMAKAADGLVRRGILPRLAAARTTADAPAPPLSETYAKRKIRKGAKPIRNWDFTGRLKRSMKVLSAGTNRAVIGFTDAETNARAYINNARVRQFGVSPADSRILGEEYGALPSPVKIVPIGKGSK